MNNNAWFKKENPFQTVIGYGGGATGFQYHSSSASKPYVDDVFSTYPYVGSGGSKTITNGIDFSGKGGLLWFKNRGVSSTQNILTDTVRGVDKVFYSDANNGSTDSTINQSFNSDGWSMSNSYGDMNGNGQDYSSWSFRKQKGFFDMVQYTGNGSARTISHGLGCIPGLIMIKCISTNNSWYVYHKELGATKYLMLNNTNSDATQSWFMNDTAPTSSVFSLGTSSNVNGSGETYMAYIFAGGESTAGNARSGNFTGSNDRLWMDGGTDFQFGTGDFTIECWVRPSTTSNPDGIYQLSATNEGLSTSYSLTVAHEGTSGQNKWVMGVSTGSEVRSAVMPVTAGQWYHVAHVRSSGVAKLYINGSEVVSSDDTTNYTFDNLVVGGYYSTSYLWKGDISNFRIVKGTAVYTSSFIPPTGPLANITGTVLLAVGVDSNIVDRTVSPTSWNIEGNPTIQQYSPFDDLDSYKFGENEDQVIIKTGKYIGNGATDGPEVYVGFEPQWLLIRGAGGGDWNIVDNMRGIVTGGNDHRLWANLTNAESTSLDVVDITSTGFKIKHDGGSFNGTGSGGMLYMAIRRPDGYVGKPPSAATDVFTMVAGDDTVEPSFAANFTVDYAFSRKPVSSYGMVNINRLTGTNELFFYNDDVTVGSDPDYASDYGTGYAKNRNNTYQAWMWKRSAGMDVVTYNILASSGQKQIRHNLNAIPEMIIMKSYTGTDDDWLVYNKYLGGGTDPWDYYLALNKSDEESNTYPNYWGTSSSDINANYFTINQQFRYTGIHMFQLFASANDADGNPISKVGSYVGDGTTNGSKVITLGFEPRFILIKGVDNGTHNWDIFDSIRGFGAGVATNYLQLNTSTTQGNAGTGLLEKSTTSFTVGCNGVSGWNSNGRRHIYYAHA